MKAVPIRPSFHYNEKPWRESVVDENEDDCSCSTDAVTVKASNVVSFRRLYVFRTLSILLHSLSIVWSPVSLSSSNLLAPPPSPSATVAHHGRCKECRNAW
jgi:hypothetical protein